MSAEALLTFRKKLKERCISQGTLPITLTGRGTGEAVLKIMLRKHGAEGDLELVNCEEEKRYAIDVFDGKGQKYEAVLHGMSYGGRKLTWKLMGLRQYLDDNGVQEGTDIDLYHDGQRLRLVVCPKEDGPSQTRANHPQPTSWDRRPSAVVPTEACAPGEGLLFGSAGGAGPSCRRHAHKPSIGANANGSTHVGVEPSSPRGSHVATATLNDKHIREGYLAFRSAQVHYLFDPLVKKYGVNKDIDVRVSTDKMPAPVRCQLRSYSYEQNGRAPKPYNVSWRLKGMKWYYRSTKARCGDGLSVRVDPADPTLMHVSFIPVPRGQEGQPAEAAAAPGGSAPVVNGHRADAGGRGDRENLEDPADVSSDDAGEEAGAEGSDDSDDDGDGGGSDLGHTGGRRHGGPSVSATTSSSSGDHDAKDGGSATASSDGDGEDDMELEGEASGSDSESDSGTDDVDVHGGCGVAADAAGRGPGATRSVRRASGAAIAAPPGTSSKRATRSGRGLSPTRAPARRKRSPAPGGFNPLYGKILAASDLGGPYIGATAAMRSGNGVFTALHSRGQRIDIELQAAGHVWKGGLICRGKTSRMRVHGLAELMKRNGIQAGDMVLFGSVGDAANKAFSVQFLRPDPRADDKLQPLELTMPDDVSRSRRTNGAGPGGKRPGEGGPAAASGAEGRGRSAGTSDRGAADASPPRAPPAKIPRRDEGGRDGRDSGAHRAQAQPVSPRAAAAVRVKEEQLDDGARAGRPGEGAAANPPAGPGAQGLTCKVEGGGKRAAGGASALEPSSRPAEGSSRTAMAGAPACGDVHENKASTRPGVQTAGAAAAEPLCTRAGAWKPVAPGRPGTATVGLPSASAPDGQTLLAASIRHLHGYLPPEVPRPPVQAGEVRVCGLTFHPDLQPIVTRILEEGRRQLSATWVDPAKLQMRIPGIDPAPGAAPAGATASAFDSAPWLATFKRHGLSRNIVCHRLVTLLGLIGENSGAADLPEDGPAWLRGVRPCSDPARGGRGLETTEPIKRNAAIGVAGGYVLPVERQKQALALAACTPKARAGLLRRMGDSAAAQVGAVDTAWSFLVQAFTLPYSGPEEQPQGALQQQKQAAPTGAGSSPAAVISMLGYGNLAALINDPRVEPRAWQDGSDVESPQAAAGANCMVLPISVRGLVLPVLVALRDIAPGEQLLRDYGAEWWQQLSWTWEVMEDDGLTAETVLHGPQLADPAAAHGGSDAPSGTCAAPSRPGDLSGDGAPLEGSSSQGLLPRPAPLPSGCTSTSQDAARLSVRTDAPLAAETFGGGRKGAGAGRDPSSAGAQRCSAREGDESARKRGEPRPASDRRRERSPHHHDGRERRRDREDEWEHRRRERDGHPQDRRRDGGRDWARNPDRESPRERDRRREREGWGPDRSRYDRPGRGSPPPRGPPPAGYPGPENQHGHPRRPPRVMCPDWGPPPGPGHGVSEPGPDWPGYRHHGRGAQPPGWAGVPCGARAPMVDRDGGRVDPEPRGSGPSSSSGGRGGPDSRRDLRERSRSRSPDQRRNSSGRRPGGYPPDRGYDGTAGTACASGPYMTVEGRWAAARSQPHAHRQQPVRPTWRNMEPQAPVGRPTEGPGGRALPAGGPSAASAEQMRPQAGSTTWRDLEPVGGQGSASDGP